MPDAWKKLTGQDTARPDAAPAVQFTPGAPPCPAHVERNRTAFAEWNRIVPELITAGLLCTVDAAALAMYCVAYAMRWTWTTVEVWWLMPWCCRRPPMSRRIS